MKNNDMQLALFGAASELSAELRQVFGTKEIKDKDGNVVGQRLGLAPRKEIGKALGLTKREDKEALDDAVLARTDAAWSELRGELMKLGPTWTLKTLATRLQSDGNRAISFKIVDVKRKTKGPSEEEYAAAFGLTVEELHAKLAEIKAKQEALDLETQPATEVKE